MIICNQPLARIPEYLNTYHQIQNGIIHATNPAVVITKDGMIPKIPKKPSGSAQASGRGSHVFTCGFEYGFSWNADVKNSEHDAWVDVKQALLTGLKNELLVEESGVKNWCITTLAIHHVHLNAALLGVVHLNLSEGELSDRIKSKCSEHFKEELTFLSIKKAREAIEKDRGTGEWHQTALMRINLIKLGGS